MHTLYDVLGVGAKAQTEEVRKAYRRLAKTFHPDLSTDPKANERMARINEAFEVLSDPVRRMEYDATLGEPITTEPVTSARDPRRPEAINAKVIHRLRDHATPVYWATYDRVSGRLVTSAFDNELIWWNRDEGEPVRRVKLEGGVVSRFSAVSDQLVVAAGSTEYSLACWRVNGEEVSVWRQTPKEWICVTAPSPDGDSLALGSVDSQLRVVCTKAGHLKFAGLGHTDSVTALAWSDDSKLLASGSADASVRIWDGVTGRMIHRIKAVRSTVTSIAFSPGSKYLAVAGVDLSLRVFNLDDLSLHQTLFGHQRPMEALAFHPAGWLLGSVSRDGKIGLWNVARGLGHGRIEASHQPLSCLAFSHDGTEMAAGGLDKTLRLWRLSRRPNSN